VYIYATGKGVAWILKRQIERKTEDVLAEDRV
jgi:hypothetical protein